MTKKNVEDLKKKESSNTILGETVENEAAELFEKEFIKSKVNLDEFVLMLPTQVEIQSKSTKSVLMGFGEKCDSGWAVFSGSRDKSGLYTAKRTTVLKKAIRKILEEQGRVVITDSGEIDFSTVRSKTTPKLESVSDKDLDQNSQLLELKTLKEKIDSLTQENIELKEVLLNSVVQANVEQKIQYIPVEIYLDTKESEIIFGVYDSVLTFLESIGFSKSIELPAINKSWYKRMLAKSKASLTSDEVVSRLKEIEYGVEVNAVLIKQSEIDKNQSEALVNILNSLEKTNNGVIRIGSLLVVKITDPSNGNVNVQVRTLSISEMYILNKDPSLLSKPQQILEALSNAIDSKTDTSTN